ncbi:MAG: AraC family transcriptional regulator [Planctomycetota bacterium]|jgi:AraC-like DNA-binding protein
MKAFSKHTTNLDLSCRPELVTAGISMQKNPGTYSYTLPDRWGLLLFHNKFNVDFLDTTVYLRPGYIALFPPEMTKTYHFESSQTTYNCLHFKTTGKGERVEQLPIIIDASEELDYFDNLFLDVIQLLTTDKERAEVVLWNILFKLLDTIPKDKKSAPRQDPVFTFAIKQIEMNLMNKISVSGLAKLCDISHNHLTNLFKKNLGLTVTGYIQKKRMERISHLLLYTNQPIKQIACECGMADLQLFNKTVKKLLGMSPRKYRNDNSKI